MSETRFQKLFGIGSGTGGRPAAGNAGARWVDTSSSYQESVDDGSGWHNMASGGGSGAMAHLDEVIVTGSVAASVSFNSISGSYRNLLITGTARGDTAAFQTNLLMQFNGDTGSNYKWVYMDVYTSGGDSAANNADTSIATGKLFAASATTNLASALRVNVYDYARTAWFKPTDSQHLYIASNTFVNSGNSNPGTANGFWLSTAAITSILLKPAAGNFAIGSVFTLFGIL